MPGCCFLLSLFLGTCCCAGGSMDLRPHRSRHRPNKSVPPGHDGSDFFLPIFISSLGCFACGFAFATRLLAYPYRPAPRPVFLHGGQGGSWLRYGRRVAVMSCLPRAATDGDGERRGWRRCHAYLISLVRCHKSHEMMGTTTGCDVGGCPLSFFARPPLARSRRSACFK